ncbi:pyridoxamine 5'-phosphate oxidase family protein [Edaphobacter flagellatus]|uniref:pyridoxamine 5'-phosphate oxidase family protein n=1 Tax=Edaphobacter flagellatus TaxID=1933044 RepID=UPI0021B3613A|nr:pyridoxamine 5'-phosphate oxidase family protein [Edaphobacter flagellatus]
MGRSFARLAFTPFVQKQQIAHGSRSLYQRTEQMGRIDDVFTEMERHFIASRDSFYISTVSETGWPYIQHRGGEPGFLRVIDERTIGFADYRGNKQYITQGNINHDNRVALFLMDYPTQSRLKILGRTSVHEGPEAQKMIAELSEKRVQSIVERVVVIHVEAFDWNCQQHITPRYTEDQIARVTAPLRQRVIDLEVENQRLRDEVNAYMTKHSTKI